MQAYFILFDERAGEECLLCLSSIGMTGACASGEIAKDANVRITKASEKESVCKACEGAAVSRESKKI